jgi:hypothetical protein
MVFNITFTDNPSAGGQRRGYSLLELLLSSGLVSLLLIVLAHLSFYGSRSFVAIANYVDLEMRSRNALDLMTREIRQSMQLAAADTSSLTLTDADGLPLQYVYNSQAQTLRRIKSGQERVLLTGCESFTVDIFQRNPTNDFNVVPTSNPALCKLIQLNWKCSRGILSGFNTESIQSAKVVIRKQ